MSNRLSELFGKALDLSARERWTVVKSWFMLPGVWIALRLLPLRRVLTLLRPKNRPNQRSHNPDPTASSRSTTRLVGVAAHFSPFPNTCLSRSLVLWSLLGRSGTEAEIRIGVLKDSDSFAAHAWVEVDGTPINDNADVGERHDVFADALTSGT